MMYLHLGQDVVIRMDEVVGIFDLDNATISKASRDFLAASTKRGEVVNVSMELPKSFVVCKNKNSQPARVYISQISSATLRKRTGYMDALANL